MNDTPIPTKMTIAPRGKSWHGQELRDGEDGELVLSMNDLKTKKDGLTLCQSKGWNDAVRVLDQSEVLGVAWGSACTLQVLDYGTGEWMHCPVGVKETYSMAHLYRFIRSALEWDGPVRVAIAAK
jgi:hypothetical protein